MIPTVDLATAIAKQLHPDGPDAIGSGDWERIERWVRGVNGGRLSDKVQHGAASIRSRLTAAASSGGSAPGNTDPPTLHLGGLDWLDLTVYGRSRDCLAKVIRRLLDEREALRADNLKEGLCWIGPLCGALKSSGTGKGFCHQPITWVYQGIKFRFGAKDGRVPDPEEQLLLFVDITGDPLLALGEVEVLQLVRRVLTLLGITVTRCRVRRIDACVDMPGQDVQEFTRAVERGQFVGRAKVQVHYGRDGVSTGFVVGGEACRLSVYDKLKETEGKEEKRAWLMAYRWHGELPSKATRVELRIRPEKCEWAEFRNLGDLLEALRRIFGWGAEAWFRLCEVKDRRHTERAKLLDVWRDVIFSFAGLCDGYEQFMGRRQPQPVEVKKLAKSALGTLATAVAQCGLETQGLAWERIFMGLLGEEGDRPIYRMEWETRVLERQVGRPNHLTS